MSPFAQLKHNIVLIKDSSFWNKLLVHHSASYNAHYIIYNTSIKKDPGDLICLISIATIKVDHYLKLSDRQPLIWGWAV